MTQLIKRKIVLLLPLFICIFISCKFSGQKKQAPISLVTKQKKVEALNGYWSCTSYEKDNRFSNIEFDIIYAEEFKDNFHFTIKKDSIKIGSCNEELYKYNFSLNNSKAKSENLFAIKSKSKDTIQILSTYENKLNSCFPLDNLTFFHSENNQIIVHEKGFFFFYSKSKPEISKDCTKEGIIGNSKNYWKLECYYSGSMSEVYQRYLKKFPFSSKFLPNKIPEKSNIDSNNNIRYVISRDKLEIFKANPMGTIYTSFSNHDNKVHMIFEMKYPEY